MRLNGLIGVGLALALVGCGSLGRMETKAGAKPQTIGEYDRVVVVDFTANDTRTPKDEAQKAEWAGETAEGLTKFSASVAREIKETGAFSEVSQGTLVAPALQVTGTVDLWEPGNVAARSITGFIGKSEFSATVVVSDLETGKELARQVVDRNSWPLPIGASTNVVQTVDYFMNQAARRVASELAKAKQAPPEAE